MTEPEPTDTELRERLQAALPGGWSVTDLLNTNSCAVRLGDGWLVACPTYAALRKPGGIEACARALRVLAGEGGVMGLLISQEESDALEAAIGDFADASIEGLSGDHTIGGKAVPYIGWYWRTVGFTHPVSLGVMPDGRCGFMQSNKWNYDKFQTTEAQTLEIVRLIREAIRLRTADACAAIQTYMDSIRPQ